MQSVTTASLGANLGLEMIYRATSRQRWDIYDRAEDKERLESEKPCLQSR